MTGNGFAVEKVDRNSGDALLLLVFILLVGVGISVLYSASYHFAERIFGDPRYFLRRQIVWIALGAVGAFIAYHLSLSFLRRMIPLLLLGTLLLTLLTFFPVIGTQALGARRWITLFGYSFQPSELIKLSLVIYLASMLARKEDRLDDPVNSLLPLLIVVAGFTSLVYLQNDFSTAFFILMISFLMFFAAGIRFRYFLSMGLVGGPLSLILLFTREHRVMRLIAFLDPASDPAGAAYQVIASRSALVRGGFWGVGLGRGIKKLGGLPEAHSDFVFAVLGEEAGMLGILLVLLLFTVFLLRSFRIAGRCEDRFASYLVIGFALTIFLQALMNMGVVSGMVPATGITLPFFSSGGSSMFVSLIMAGFILNVSRNALEPTEERYG